VILRVQLPDRVVTADVAAKSLRKAQAAIREAGVDGVAVILQGALAAGDEITEAGLSAQPKAPKAVA
jgi:predicted O-methyltransferase YrrM